MSSIFETFNFQLNSALCTKGFCTAQWRLLHWYLMDCENHKSGLEIYYICSISVRGKGENDLVVLHVAAFPQPPNFHQQGNQNSRWKRRNSTRTGHIKRQVNQPFYFPKLEKKTYWGIPSVSSPDSSLLVSNFLGTVISDTSRGVS